MIAKTVGQPGLSELPVSHPKLECQKNHWTNHLSVKCLGDTGTIFEQHALDIWVTHHLDDTFQHAHRLLSITEHLLSNSVNS